VSIGREETLRLTPFAAVGRVEHPVAVLPEAAALLGDRVEWVACVREAASVLVLEHSLAGALALDSTLESGEVVVLVVNAAGGANETDATANATGRAADSTEDASTNIALVGRVLFLRRSSRQLGVLLLAASRNLAGCSNSSGADSSDTNAQSSESLLAAPRRTTLRETKSEASVTRRSGEGRRVRLLRVEKTRPALKALLSVDTVVSTAVGMLALVTVAGPEEQNDTDENRRTKSNNQTCETGRGESTVAALLVGAVRPRWAWTSRPDTTAS